MAARRVASVVIVMPPLMGSPYLTIYRAGERSIAYLYLRVCAASVLGLHLGSYLIFGTGSAAGM